MVGLSSGAGKYSCVFGWVSGSKRETSASRTYLGDSAKNLLNPRTPILPCAPSTTPELFRVSLAGHHRTNGVLLVKLRENVLGV